MGLVRKEVPGGAPGSVGSLAEALAAVPEPRRPYGWRPGREPLPLVGLLQVTVVATLCGARSQAAIVQWARERLEDRPAALGVLGAWLARTGVRPVEAVAVAGEWLRRVATPVKGQELAAAGALLGDLPLAWREVTGDARLTRRAICAQVV